MNDKDRNSVLMVIGLALIAGGLWWLFSGLLAPMFAPLEAVVRFLRSIAWPLVIIAAGALFLFLAQRGDFADRVKGKRLYRSRSNRMIAGVLGGFAKYFEVDATWLRIGYALLALALGIWPGLVLYLAAVVIVPEEPEFADVGSAGAPFVGSVPPPPVPARPVPGGAPEPPQAPAPTDIGASPTVPSAPSIPPAPAVPPVPVPDAAAPGGPAVPAEPTAEDEQSS